ncbi:12202_t:CDS:2, partial [Racocetra fulgida]
MSEQISEQSIKLNLIENNLKFTKLKGSEFFENLADEQKPTSLLIFSPELITQSDLGEIFVLRNVANQFKRKDPSALAVLEFAVEKLG